LSPCHVKPKIKIGISCLSAKQAAIKE